MNPPGSRQFLKQSLRTELILEALPVFRASVLEGIRAETWQMRAVHGEKKTHLPPTLHNARMGPEMFIQYWGWGLEEGS